MPTPTATPTAPLADLPTAPPSAGLSHAHAAVAVRARVVARLNAAGLHKLASLFNSTFLFTLEKTFSWLADEPHGSLMVVTGDIPNLWVRDSTGQVGPYIHLAASDPELQRVLEGLVRRQQRFLRHDPYANAFSTQVFRGIDPSWQYWQREEAIERQMGGYVRERKYELDNPCYFFRLSAQLWREVGTKTRVFDREWLDVVKLLMEQIVREQQHEALSHYRYRTLLRNGLGAPVANGTGMSWSAFRPSDDQCVYNFHIPSNLMAVAVLGPLRDMLLELYPEEKTLLADVIRVREEIHSGVLKHAQVDVPGFGKVYAYEVDGLGKYLLRDDANVPSLLSLPYFGFDDEIVRNTRRWALSPRNSLYFDENGFYGVGSDHTNVHHRGYIWPMSLIMRALTSQNNVTEIIDQFRMLCTSDGATNLIHESFAPRSRGSTFTRKEFGWANALFSEAVLKFLELLVKAAPTTDFCRAETNAGAVLNLEQA